LLDSLLQEILKNTENLSGGVVIQEQICRIEHCVAQKIF